MNVITIGQATAIVLFNWPFQHGDKRPNKQPGDPSASLLLTSEKAVFCNIDAGSSEINLKDP